MRFSGSVARTFLDVLRSLPGDVSGIVLPYATLMLVVIVGGSLLAVDGARFMGLHTQLQKAADAYALAAAAELDRQPTAIERANRAVNDLLTNGHVFGDGGDAPVQVASIRFLESLPSDDQPLSARHETTDPARARFVEVTVVPVGLRTVFPAEFIGAAAGLVTTSATAVAGFDQVVCDFTPLFICNPFEVEGDPSAANRIYTAANDSRMRRRSIELRGTGGTNTQYFPGNFGFLEPPTGSGARDVREMIAKVRPEACFRQSGVLLRTGQLATVRDAINVRFDIYDGPFSPNSSNYRPAANVRKGYETTGANACRASRGDDTRFRALTRDLCFGSGGCSSSEFSPHMQNRIGDGRWDFDGYWSINFGSRPKPVGPDGSEYSNANPPPRYDVYRYEIGNGLIGVRSAGGESGAPACYRGSSAPSDNPDRRILQGAVLNCLALNQDPRYGPLRGGSTARLPVAAFAKFFITEPVDRASESSIWVEFVDVVRPDSSGSVVRDIVQLHR